MFARRKYFLILILLLIVVQPLFLFAAGKTTINIWALAGPQTNMYQSWKAIYEADHPNVTINITSHEQNAIMDVMTSALSSGAEDLDISFYWGGAAIDTWARDGLLLDLTEYTKKYGWYEKKNVGAKGYATEGRGNFYFTTDWVTVPHYFYNKDIFKKVGVTPPQIMDDLFSICKKIKASGLEAWSVGVVDRWPVGGIFNDILARVMPKDDFNKFINWERDPNKNKKTAEIFKHAAAEEAWGYIRQLIDAGVFVKGANSMDDSTSRQLFNKGTTAIYDSGSWTMDIFKNDAPNLNYDYFNLPKIKGKISICSGYNGLIIPNYVAKEKIPALMDFLNATFGKQYAQAVFKVGAIPDNTTINPSDFSGEVHPFVLRILQDVKTYGDVGIIDALQSPALRQGYYDTIAAFFDRKITPKEAAEKMYKNALAILD